MTHIKRIDEFVKTNTRASRVNENNSNNDRIDINDKGDMDDLITLITHGEIDSNENEKIPAPLTHETITAFIPELTKEDIKKIDAELKKRGLNWKYPHNKDAVKSGKWKMSALNELEFDENYDAVTDESIKNNKDLILAISNIIEYGDIQEDEGSNVLAPITHETIFSLFPLLTNKGVEYIDDYMNKNGKKWKYPHNEDAIKSGRWTIDQLR